MKTSLTLITLLAGASAFAQVPRTEPAFPTPPVTGVPPQPLPGVAQTNIAQTNIFAGPATPGFTNPAPIFTNGFAIRGLTNRPFVPPNTPTGLFQPPSSAVGGAPGLNGAAAGGLTNRPFVPPSTPATPAPPAPTAPDAIPAPPAPTAPEVPTLPGATPTTPGVPPIIATNPPALPGNTPALPNGANATGTIPPVQQDSPVLGTPETPGSIGGPTRGRFVPPGLNQKGAPPVRVPQQQVPPPAPAPPVR